MAIDYDNIVEDVRNGNYRHIGHGSGREVYDLGDGNVVKIAKNQKGIAQNQMEFMISSKERSKIIAKVIMVSEDYVTLIMEKAEKFYDPTALFNYLDENRSCNTYRLKEIERILKKYDLIRADIKRPSSWGLINELPVLVDYGYTRDVRRQFYLPT